MSSFRRDAKEIIKRHSPLERAMFQKAIFEELVKNGSIWTRILFMQPQRSRECVNSLVLYEKIAAQAARPEWKGSKCMKPGFDTWVRLCFLHLWLMEVRFRYLLDAGERDRLTQPIYSWMWEDIELGLIDVLDTTNTMVIVKHSKRLVHEWFGAALSFDVGMITSDVSLGEAIWRNVFNGNPEMDMEELAKLVHYVRKTQQVWMEETDEALTNAEIHFLDPPFELPEDEKVKLKEEGKLFSMFTPAPDYTPLADAMELKLKELEQELEKDGNKKQAKE